MMKRADEITVVRWLDAHKKLAECSPAHQLAAMAAKECGVTLSEDAMCALRRDAGISPRGYPGAGKPHSRLDRLERRIELIEQRLDITPTTEGDD
jgi:hypothetical protein